MIRIIIIDLFNIYIDKNTIISKCRQYINHKGHN